jgi:hypothetical protein
MSVAGIAVKDKNGVTIMDTRSSAISVVATATYTSGYLEIPFNELFTHVEVLFQPMYPTDTTEITVMPTYTIDYDNNVVALNNGSATTSTLVLVLGK